MLSQAPPSPPPPSHIPRPPTPPRGSTKTHETLDLFPRNRTTQFPSPESSAGFNTPVDASRKKVGWSTWTDYQEYPDISTKRNSSLFPSSSAPILLSSERKPPRSILKSRNVLTTRDPNDSSTPPPTYRSFAAMLESAVQQLAAEDRASRIDAYKLLSGTLRGFDNNIPDLQALKDKMGLISQFIQRDFYAKTSAGAADTALFTNALVLLSSLLYKPPIAEFFAHDFSVFVMDFAIHSFETGQPSKEIIAKLLLVVASQSFSVRVMNAERLRKLIIALHNIEEQVKGKAIVMGRTQVYLRLLKQGRSSMLANTMWIEDMFHDMVSSFKEIRSLAIKFGTEAGLLLGTESQTSKCVQEHFQLERDDGVKFSEFYAGRLEAMLKNEPDSIHVPQIWAIVILFLRARRKQIESWENMKPWLLVIQPCMNSPEIDLKMQAIRAWNKFVFAVHPDEKTMSNMVNIIWSGIFGHLTKKNLKKNEKEFRKVIHGCICNLLYYVFRPDASSAQVDRYWEAYMVPLMKLPLRLKGEKTRRSANGEEKLECFDISHACSILSALLNTTPKIWNENRVNDNNHLTPAELPSLDPQWVRKNTHRIIALMEPLIQASFDDLSRSDSPVSTLWTTFCEALAAAGAKEIKVSNDTMKSIAQIYGMLYRLWNQQILPSNANALLLQGFGSLFSSLTSKLGVLPFTEKRLSLDLPSTFDVITTPSIRPKGGREIKSPLHHLVSLTCQARSDIRNNDDYTEMIKKMLLPFFNARESRRTCLDFITEVNSLLPAQSLLGELGNSAVWEVLVKFTEQALEKEEDNRNSGSNSEEQLGSEYRCALKILEAGLGTASDSTQRAAVGLFHTLMNCVKAESGDSGVAIAVIEPLARGLLERRVPVSDKLLTSYCTILLANAHYPKDRQALEVARKRVWGSVGGGRLSSTDPYIFLYGLASRCLISAYGKLSLEECKDLILGVSAMLERCPIPHLFHALDKVQEGLSCWIQDADRKLTDVEMLSTLCTRTNKCVKKLPNVNTMTLKKLCVLIGSGLQCRHKFVANAAVETWNLTFGNQKSLEYPPRIKEALLRLQIVSELKLPSFPNSLSRDFSSAPPEFYETQDYGPTSVTPAPSDHRGPPIETSSVGAPSTNQNESPGVVIEVKLPTSKKRRFEGTPEPVSRKQTRRSMAKLRHDDSQVQFSTIQSSPMSDAVMDSQLLTDRQREVKERQKTDAAAIFQNFRSSPTSRSNRSVPKLPSHIDSPSMDTAQERPATPIIDAADPNVFDDYISSSPTPRRGGAILPDSDAMEEPPSSPPEKINFSFPSSRSRRNSPVISQDYGETSFGDVTVGFGGVLQSKPDANPLEPELPTKTLSETIPGGSQRVVESNTPAVTPSTPVRGLAERTRTLRSPELESEVFVDALSSPAKFKPLETKTKKNTPSASNLSLEMSSLPQETPRHLQSSQGSQGMARGILNAAMNLQTNIKSFISPPKQPPIISTASSPLDEDSVLRVMNQFDRPDEGTPIGASFSQSTSRHDYDNLSEVQLPSGIKKRKRSSLTPNAEPIPNTQPPSQRDSQESWKPSQPEEIRASVNLLENNKALFPSTIPETPVRPDATVGINSSDINPASSISRRPFTRSARRLALTQSRLASSGMTGQPARDSGAQESQSSQHVAERVTEASAAAASIELDNPQMLDFDHDISLDLDHEEEFASTPKSRIVVEVTRSSPSKGANSVEDAPVPANEADEEDDALPPHKENTLEPAQGEVDVEIEMELPRERGSSPSQQLLRDSDESSQRLQLARENSSLSNSLSPRQAQGVEATSDAVVAATEMSVEDHLRAAMDGLSGAVLGSREVFGLEELLLRVKRKLIEAEERGRGA